jgi:hypothetical protein
MNGCNVSPSDMRMLTTTIGSYADRLWCAQIPWARLDVMHGGPVCCSPFPRRCPRPARHAEYGDSSGAIYATDINSIKAKNTFKATGAFNGPFHVHGVVDLLERAKLIQFPEATGQASHDQGKRYGTWNPIAQVMVFDFNNEKHRLTGTPIEMIARGQSRWLDEKGPQGDFFREHVYTEEFKLDAIPVHEIPIHAAYTEGPYAIDSSIGRSGDLAVAPEGRGPGHSLRKRLGAIGFNWHPFTTSITSVAFNSMSPSHATCPTHGHGDFGGSTDPKKWQSSIWKGLSGGYAKWRKMAGDRWDAVSPIPEHVVTAIQRSIKPPLDRAPNEFDNKGYATVNKSVVAANCASLSPLALGAVKEMVATSELATSGSTLHFVGVGSSKLFGYPPHLDAHWQGALRNGAANLSKELLTSIDTGLPHHKGVLLLWPTRWRTRTRTRAIHTTLQPRCPTWN